jgi:hypothetical protein
MQASLLAYVTAGGAQSIASGTFRQHLMQLGQLEHGGSLYVALSGRWWSAASLKLRHSPAVSGHLGH